MKDLKGGSQTCGALEWLCISLPLGTTLSEEAPRKKLRKTNVTGTYDIPDDMSAQLENLIHQILTVAPERRPFIEAIIQNPWVKGSKINIQKEPYLDPKIIDNLTDHGFPRNIILESPRNRKRDKIMGMYLLLIELSDHRLHSTPSATWADPAPPPFPVPPSTTGRYLEGNASEPTFGLSGQMMVSRAPCLCGVPRRSPLLAKPH